MNRQTDRATGVGDAAGDRLADPPGGIGGELEALAPVELLDGVHQAEVALLDQVEQRQAGRLILLGDRHDETKVRLDEGLLGGVTLAGGAPKLALLGRSQRDLGVVQLAARVGALFDHLGEAHLVVLGEQRILADVGEVEADKVLLVALYAIFRHVVPFGAESEC